MLNTIKNIINQKEEFLESAQIIYEDTIDDIEKYITEDDDDSDEIDVMTDNTIVTKDDKPVDATIVNDNTEIISEDDINDNDISLDDIFDINIDIKTNTISDVLPVPPMNASDAVIDNIMDMNINDGFDDNDDSIDNKSEENKDLFNESISIDASAEQTDDSELNNDSKDEPDEPNDVTNAVIDKVNDAESTPTPSEDVNAKDKLMDKLDKLNKGILDLKENIKKNMA